MKNDSVLLSLQRATHVTLHRLAADLADLDLTGSEINVLGNLAGRPARTVSDLGAAVGTKPATLTGILDRLERRGLIARAAHPTDRRAVLIELTADGRTTAATVTRAIGVIERHALAAVPAEALAGFHAMLAALAGEVPS